MQIVLPGLDNLGIVHDLIARYETPRQSEPFSCSAGLAKSILQKAVRRGDIEIARRAALTLLQIAPIQLWRRIGGIAMEDVGFGDWQTVESVTRLAHSKRERNRFGDGWQIAAFAVDTICSARKCRSSDDLYMVSERHPAFSFFRSQAKQWTDGKRLAFINGAAPVIERAIAVTSFLMAESHGPYRSIPRERVDRLLRAFFDAGVSAAIVEIADRSFRTTGEVLPFMACLLAPLMPKSEKTDDDNITPMAMIDGTPNWAFDLFCEEGRAALRHFLTFDCPSARLIRTTVPAAKQLGAFGHLLFRIEGQRCRQRRRWKLADDLQRIMDLECHAPYFPNASHILQLIKDDLDLLNLARYETCNSPLD